MRRIGQLKGLVMGLALVMMCGIAFATVSQNLALDMSITYNASIKVKLVKVGDIEGGATGTKCEVADNNADLKITAVFDENETEIKITFMVVNDSIFPIIPAGGGPEGSFIAEPDYHPALTYSGSYATLETDNDGVIEAKSSSGNVTFIITCDPTKEFTGTVTISLSFHYYQQVL